MKIYLVPQMTQVENLVNSLGALALADVHEALVLDITDVESAGAVTRLLDAIGQQFDVVHPATYRVDPAVTAWVMGDAQPPNFNLVDLRPPEVAQVHFEPYHTPELPVIDDLRHDLEAAQPVEPVDSAMVEDMPAVMPVIDYGPSERSFWLNVSTEVQPAARGVELVCTHCGETWRAKRKDMRYCLKPECQAAKKVADKARWNERYRQDKLAALQANKAAKKAGKAQMASGPTDAELVEAQTFEATLAAEIAEEPPMAGLGQEVVEEPAEVQPPATPPAIEVQELRHWTIVTGRDSGQHLSSPELIARLAEGSLSAGQRLYFDTAGKYKIVKRTNGRGLGVLREYGPDSPCMVVFSDPQYA
jgi:hypothetical protein